MFDWKLQTLWLTNLNLNKQISNLMADKFKPQEANFDRKKFWKYWNLVFNTHTKAILETLDVYKDPKSPKPLTISIYLTRQCQWLLQFSLTRQCQRLLPFSLSTEKALANWKAWKAESLCLLCLELASLTGYSPCMAKLPMGLATLGHVYGHSKFVNVTDGLLLHACILLKIHVEKTFKTISFGELVCKSAPLGQFAPSCWLPLIQLKDEEGQPLGVSISNLLIANSSSDLPVRKWAMLSVD